MPQYEERSSLWGIASGGALLGGLGYSIYKGRSDLLAALKLDNRDVAEEVSQAAARFSRISADKVIAESTSDLRRGLLNLTNDTSKAMLRSNLAHGAYESILAGGKISQKEAHAIFQKIMSQENIGSLYKFAEQEITRNAGDFSAFNRAIKETMKMDISGDISSAFDLTTSKGGIIPLNFKKNAFDLLGVEKDIALKNKEAFIEALNNDRLKKMGINFTSLGTTMVDDGGRITPMFSGEITREGFKEGIKINVPLLNTGAIYSGENFTTKYITRKAYDERGEVMGSVERYLSSIRRSMESASNKDEAMVGISKIYKTFFEDFADDEAKQGAAAIWSMPDQALTSGGLAKNRLIQQQLAWAGVDDFTSERAIKLINANKIHYSGQGPMSAKGTAYAEDMATKLYGDLGELFPTDIGAERFIRADFGLTEEAKNLATASRLNYQFGTNAYKELIYGADMNPLGKNAYGAPSMLTFFAKPAEKTAVGGIGFADEGLNKMLSAETAIVDTSVANMMEVEEAFQKKIRLDEGLNVNESLFNSLNPSKRGFQDIELSSGILGVESDTGRKLSLADNERLIGAQITGENEATIYMKRKHSLAGGAKMKVFSQQGRPVLEAGNVQRYLEAAGVQDLAGIEQFTNAKQLSKNAYARVIQQTEAMQYFMQRRSGPMSEQAASFIEDPLKFMGINKGLWANDFKNAEELIDTRMVQHARSFGFGDEQLGQIFGLMNAERAEKLGIGTAVSQSKGVVGYSQNFVGDIVGRNMGQMASFDAAGFRALAMKGDSGLNVAAEFSSRLIGKGEVRGAGLLAASTRNDFNLIEQAKDLFGKADIPTDTKTLTQLGENELIQDTGRYVNLGTKVESMGGTEKIYIPGRNEMPSSLRSNISRGEVIESDIKKNITSLQKALSYPNNREAIESAGAELMRSSNALFQKQSLAEGRVAGSQFLTGVRAVSGSSGEEASRIIKVGSDYARSFDDLIARTTSESEVEFLKQQKKSFLAGDVMTGVAWRHPMTGPESSQFVHYQFSNNIGKGTMEMPAIFGKMKLQGVGGKEIEQMVDMSMNVGMRGDFDMDMYALGILKDRGNVEGANKYLGAVGSVTSDYEQSLFQHHALKINSNLAAGNAAAETLQEARAAQFAKGSETKLATGMVNDTLTKMKLGVMYASPDKYKSLAPLLAEIEQSAISKHGATGGALYDELAKTFRNKDVKGMASLFEGMWGGKEFKATGSFLEGGSGKQLTYRLGSEEAAEQIINSGADFDQIMEENQAYKIARGKKQIESVAQAQMMANRLRSGSMDPARALMTQNEGRLGSATEKANRTLNKMASKASAFGRAFGKVKGPALIGAAAAAGIAMMAPSVSGSISPKAEGTSGGRQMGSGDLGPGGGQGMSPPPPRVMASPKTYDISGLKNSSHANIRMSLNDANSNSQFSRYSRQLSKNADVRIRTVDDRAALDPQRLASKIHERL